MSEEKQYPIWQFVTVPPYDWRFPIDTKVVCVENPVSIIDTPKILQFRARALADRFKFGCIISDFRESNFHPELDSSAIAEKLFYTTVKFAPDYVGCTHLYDIDGVQLPSRISADEVLTVLGSIAAQNGAKVFYRIDAREMEEKHIGKIYQMIRGGQIDTLVVDGHPDKVTKEVLWEMEYLRVEVVVRPYDVR